MGCFALFSASVGRTRREIVFSVRRRPSLIVVIAMYGWVKKALFRMDAERAHELTFRMLETPAAAAFLRTPKHARHPGLRKSVFGIDFPNPVGLAAGMDKNARLLSVWKKLGFGYVEVGAVTPRPQAGNPKPRLFRLVEDRALINRMGFNNDGMTAVARRLENRPNDLVVGVNIGKNKDTPNDEAYKDYAAVFRTLYDHGDFFVVNVSSPNTEGLRDLQQASGLGPILWALAEENARRPRPKPILLKLAPDLAVEAATELAQFAANAGVSGFVAGNTTLARGGLKDRNAHQAGGLSGAPVKAFNLRLVGALKPVGLPVVGVGGIFSAQDAADYWHAGANLVQVYTGFVYRGPELVGECLNAALNA